MAWFTAPQDLRDLAFRYALAVDSRDAAGLAALFTPDGALASHPDGHVRYRGEEGWRRMIAEVSASFIETMHNVHNQAFDRDEAGQVTGVTTGVASHLVETSGGGLTVLDFAMRYHDRFAWHDGAWQFAERKLEVVWVETRPVRRFSPEMFGRELAGFR